MAKFKVQNSNKQLINVSIIGILSIHLVSCAFLFLASLHNYDENSWTSQIHESNGSGMELYIVAVYWTVQSIATIGLGDIKMMNQFEVLDY